MIGAKVDRSTKIFMGLRSAIIAGLVFLLWLHRHAPSTQTLLVSLIGVGGGAFFGAWLGHSYARRRDQEKAEQAKTERRHNLMKTVKRLLSEDSGAIRYLAKYDGKGTLLDRGKLDLSALDSVVGLWYELLHDLGPVALYNGMMTMPANVLFQLLRQDMRHLQFMVDSQRQIDIRLACGDKDLNIGKTLSYRECNAETIRDCADGVIQLIDIFRKLIDENIPE